MKFTILRLATAAALAAAVPASAAPILVINHSFEILPEGGLSEAGCGTGCSYSLAASGVPGWSLTGTQTGQFKPGTDQSNFSYFSTLADGPTSAYSNGGVLTQQVGGTAVAGTSYKLTVALGARNDIAGTGQILLSEGNTTVAATGIAPTAGNWSDYTAIFRATSGQAGGPIIISLLNAGGGQGNWDNVRLDAAAVPEPASWAMLIAGFGLIGAALRRRRGAVTV